MQAMLAQRVFALPEVEDHPGARLRATTRVTVPDTRSSGRH
jgi:hypothetical protein